MRLRVYSYHRKCYKVKFIFAVLLQPGTLWGPSPLSGCTIYHKEKIMARITVEDCLKRVDNRFALIHLAAKRVRGLRKGAEPLVVCKNEDIVTSLREIAGGGVFQVKEPSDGLLTEGTETDPAEAPVAQSAESASEGAGDKAETPPESAEEEKS
jgi:DNA-directed RNA polymerase subunit omega